MNWISVNDRLPEKAKGARDFVVLVFTISGDWCKASYDFDNNTWWRLDSKSTAFRHNEVTHWCEVTPPRKITSDPADIKTLDYIDTSVISVKDC
ncbi:DUF551 domain-containing protein [Parapedobacter indicus]|uniref:DUF551 domain-containing protein n=1 Tax=Parapedobacter indicus TaxID=1477437 RepID=A0A1I3E298_9SPHI|nr:uncharacterized protein DUF551 [Parapedobacter indicus]SFH93122.1 Protein of unknown function [Parapedobacter indicus]